MDEVAAGLRIAGHAGTARLVVDTAPTGHTLRLLDLETVVRSWTAALRAMADRAATVASALVGADARLSGARVIDALDAEVERFGEVVEGAAFVVVRRADAVVEAETVRLVEALRGRGLRVAAIVTTGSGAGSGSGGGEGHRWRGGVAWIGEATGCAGLRAWSAAVAPAGVNATGIDAIQPARIVTASPSPGGIRLGGADLIARLPQRLLFVAGKGGVGKTTIAAAIAVRLAEDRAVLLLGADPAGSIDDVLPDAAGVRGLRVRQVDAGAVTGALRERYRRDVEALFARLGPGGRTTPDRRVADTLIDLAPPGIDEVAAILDLIAEAAGDETVVVDSAPTGHFLRLMALPRVALDWTHSLLRVLLKYRAASALDGAAESLLRFAKQLKDLDLKLTDPARCGLILVTLDEPVVLAETDRLEDAIGSAKLHMAARVVNGGASVADPMRAPTIRAPRTAPPTGADHLRDFIEHWEVAA
jgi:arsenite-transporting ATPase